MAKKFVRGVTGVDNIEKFDKTLTNVNDLISDGLDTYVHTIKGNNESYYKLTNSLKSVMSDNSDLITVTKDDTTNTATIHPKHDPQKQDKLNSSISIAVTNGQWLRQVYFKPYTYNSSNGLLKTRVKSIANNTTPDIADEEFNFIVKINKGATSATFTLNANDATKFTNIMSAYGKDNTVSISGCVFTLSGSTLTVTTANNTQQNYVITFSDII